MTRLFQTGFDLYGTSQASQIWTSSAWSLIGTANSRWATGQGGVTNGGVSCSKTWGTNETSLICGFAANLGANSVTTLGDFFRYIDGASTNQVSLASTATGALAVYHGGTAGTQLAVTSAGYIVAGVWHYYEIKVLFATGATGTYEVRVDGNATPVLSGSGVITATTNARAQSILFASVGGGSPNFFDDIYLINTTAGPPNNDFLGDTRVEGRVPTGAGNYAQWTPSTGSNWQNVDDIPPNDDTDYNYSSTTNQIDSFSHQALTSLSGTVRWVAHFIRGRKDDAGTRKVAAFFRMGTNDHVGTDDTLSTSYQYFEQDYETSPDTSSAWTVTEVNSCEIGYKLTA